MLRPEVDKRLVIGTLYCNFFLKSFFDLAAGVENSDMLVICLIFQVIIGIECWHKFLDSVELGHHLGYFL
jgi:hypothetical protein